VGRYSAEYLAYFDSNKADGDKASRLDPHHLDPRCRYDHHRQEQGDGRCCRRALPPGDRRHDRKCRDGRLRVALGVGVVRCRILALELYKLSLAPPEADFSRQVAFTGGGVASAARRLPVGQAWRTRRLCDLRKSAQAVPMDQRTGRALRFR